MEFGGGGVSSGGFGEAADAVANDGCDAWVQEMPQPEESLMIMPDSGCSTSIAPGVAS